MKEDTNNKILETSVNLSRMSQTANEELGITREYNKENRDKLWDSTKGKAEYKEKVFGNKETYVDPISGKVLHKSHKAAKSKYHAKNAEGETVSSKWAQHAAETDHINALKDVHDKVKNNPFLSDDDFKKIMNSDENYRILSKSVNASKGEANDWKIIADRNSGLSVEGKVQMAKEKVKADVALHTKFAARTVQNAGKEFASGAADTLVMSAIPLTVEAVNKMINVAQGEESLGDAVKDMGKITLDVAVAGGTNKLLIDMITSQIVNSKNPIIKNIAGSNGVAQIISVSMIVKESAVKYVNGEIDGKEFIEEVGQKGTMMVAGMIGGQVGREIGGMIGAVMGTAAIPGTGTAVGAVAGKVVGEILGTVITTVACSAIICAYHAVTDIGNTLKHMDDYKLKESQIRRLETEALREMENQRMKFRSIVEREYKVWDETIESGFNQMICCACESVYSIQGVTEGLDRILSLFGKQVTFKTLKEYESQLDMPLVLKF